jgi:TonB family protein
MCFPGKDGRLASRLRFQAPRWTGLAFLLLQLLAIALAAPGQQQNATEDQVKAAYLLNFARLAEWPPQALPDGPSPLVIGVAGGDEEFLKTLKAVVAGKIIGTHPVVVRPVASDLDVRSCQIVFFRESARKHFLVDLAGLAQASVLSVGESDSFLRQGGMINLIRDHGSIHFEVNADALDRSVIHFNSKILALAKGGYESVQPAPSTAQGEGMRPIEKSIPPEYPALARRINLKGTAQVQAVVRPDGTVKQVTILGGHPLLADALARAVKQWRYQPAPTETLEVVKFSFSP